MKKKHNRNTDSDDDDSQISNEINTDNSPKYIPIAKLGDKPKCKKIVINIYDTQYPIVEEIAQQLGWLVQKTEGVGDWDVWWTDRQIQPNTLFRMNLHQKINHFPGIYILARKNLLGLNLMAMREYFPNQYNFFPETWTIPLQFSQFRHYYQSIEKGRTRTFIVKPQALSQGRGIFLTRNIEDVLNGNKYVIQRYLKNPLLIDKLKFDLRIYVLLAGTDPLRLYIYHDGLTRFATQQYQQPNNQNLSRSYIHLTNYSLNKSNPNYIYNTSDKDMDKGHKRTLSSTYQKLQKNGVDVEKLKLQIEEAIIKTVISGLPSIRHQYKYCQPQQYEGNMCFHILGFDVMITDQLKPIVIQVNHTPSFQTGTPLDYLIKKNLIKDTLKLMRITKKNKQKYFQRAKQIAKIRLQTGKREIFKGKQRQQIIKKTRIQRDQAEKDLLGGYKRIYPPQKEQDEKRYEAYYQIALKISRQDNQTRKNLLNEEKQKQKNKKKQKVQPKIIPVNKIEDNKSCDQFYQTISHNDPKSNNQLDQLQKNLQILVKQQKNLQNVSQLSLKQVKNDYPKDELVDGKQKKINFRMKINKKSNSSNNQLIKYTDSIKKFNQLMVKFMVNKEDISYNPQRETQPQSFLKLKERIYFPNEAKNSLQNVSKNQKQQKFNSQTKQLRLEIRNGSFVKPKTYLINEYQSTHAKKLKRNQQDKNSNEPILQINQYLIGGIIIENKSSKAYSKLLKTPFIKNSFVQRK